MEAQDITKQESNLLHISMGCMGSRSRDTRFMHKSCSNYPTMLKLCRGNYFLWGFQRHSKPTEEVISAFVSLFSSNVCTVQRQEKSYGNIYLYDRNPQGKYSIYLQNRQSLLYRKTSLTSQKKSNVKIEKKATCQKVCKLCVTSYAYFLEYITTKKVKNSRAWISSLTVNCIY